METLDWDEAIETLRTVNDCVRWGVSQFRQVNLFYGHGTDNAEDDALQLVLYALHLPHGLSPELMASRLTRREREQVLALLARRITERKPAPYLTQCAWFAGLQFYVDERVLIPRSPLAEVIERQFAPWSEAESIDRVLDLCTGSACIAIACAHFLPHASVDAIELSTAACAVAQKNVEHHDMETRVKVLQGDLFAPVAGERYQVIISNPPYVGQAEYATLPAEYRHEPVMALTSGQDGLDIVVRILRDARAHLTDEGILVCEVGNTEDALMQRFPDVPFTWLEFERGGGGVFMLTAQELQRFRKVFE